MALKDRLADLPVVGTALAVQRRTKADAADQFGAAIGFFGFVSLIPLVAIAVAAAARLLAGRPDRLATVIDGIEGAIPALGASEGLEQVIATVASNSGSIGLIGGAILLVAGLRVTNALQTATRFVFDLPLADAKAVKLRLWQLLSLVVLGTLALVGVVATSTAATLLNSTVGQQFGVGAAVLGFAVGGLLDILLFWVAYRMYTFEGAMSWRDLLPGAILGGVGWALLKSFGTEYAARQAQRLQERTTTGATEAAEAGAGVAAGVLVASVIGLLLVFYLAGRLYLYGAELSATLMGVTSGATAHDEDVDSAAAEAGTDEARVDEAGEAGRADRRADVASHRPEPVGSLAQRFRERGALVDASVVAPTEDGTGTEVVPWQAPLGSPLDDRRNRQVVAFATSALAVVTAGLLGRRR